MPNNDQDVVHSLPSCMLYYLPDSPIGLIFPENNQPYFIITPTELYFIDNPCLPVSKNQLRFPDNSTLYNMRTKTYVPIDHEYFKKFLGAGNILTRTQVISQFKIEFILDNTNAQPLIDDLQLHTSIPDSSLILNKCPFFTLNQIEKGIYETTLYEQWVINAESALNGQKLLKSGSMLGIEIGKGGFKRIFAYEDNPDLVIAVRNFTVDRINPSSVNRWIEAVLEEKAMSDFCASKGLRTQAYEIQLLQADQYEVPVLVMPSFQSLRRQGKYVRDTKTELTHQNSDNSLIFGSKENITSDYLRFLMNYLIEDIVNCLIYNIPLHEDTFNLIIENTENTPPYEADRPALFSDRGQILKLYLFDFSSKWDPCFPLSKAKLSNGFGSPDYKVIRHEATKYISIAYRTLIKAICSEECEILTHSGYVGYVTAPLYKTIEQELIEQVVARVTAYLLKENVHTLQYERSEEEPLVPGLAPHSANDAFEEEVTVDCIDEALFIFQQRFFAQKQKSSQTTTEDLTPQGVIWC